MSVLQMPARQASQPDPLLLGLGYHLAFLGGLATFAAPSELGLWIIGLAGLFVSAAVVLFVHRPLWSRIPLLRSVACVGFWILGSVFAIAVPALF